MLENSYGVTSMNEIIIQIGEYIYTVVLIIWLIFHGIECIWVIITGKSPQEMHSFFQRFFKKKIKVFSSGIYLGD